MMPIDRNIWKPGFFENSFTRIPCPNCQTGLSLDKKTLAKEMTVESNNSYQQSEVDPEPEWEFGRFSCLLRCQHCREIVAVAGKYHVEEWAEGSENRYDTVFYPRLFLDAPDIFPIPAEVPDEIATEIHKAFELYWIDISASANRVRVGVENVLTHLGELPINRRTLDARIKSLETSRPDVSEDLRNALLAVKIIGNAGSHASELTPDDLFDALEIVEHVFQEVFVKHPERINKITDEINRKKAPRSTP